MEEPGTKNRNANDQEMKHVFLPGTSNPSTRKWFTTGYLVRQEWLVKSRRIVS